MNEGPFNIDLSEIEYKLNKIEFMGVPLGSTLANDLQVDFLFSKNANLNCSYLKLFVRTLKFLVFGTQVFKINKKCKQNLPLLTSISEKHHFRLQIEKIIEALDGQCNVFLVANILTTNGKIHSLLKKKNAFFLNKDYFIWRLKFLLNCFSILNTLRFAFKGFSIKYKWNYFNLIIIQYAQIYYCFVSLKKLKPKYILTEYDRNDHIAPLILVANKLNIKTFTLQHGAINHKIGYLPLLANKIFLWGDFHKNELSKLGLAGERMVVTGGPHLNENPLKNSLKKGSIINQFVITLATNPIGNDLRIKLVNGFVDLIYKLRDSGENCFGIIRIHPSESISFYNENGVIENNFLKFENFETTNFIQAIEKSDLIVNFNSAFGFDALIEGKPIVAFNIDDNLFWSFGRMVEYFGIPKACNNFELYLLVKGILTDKHNFMNLKEKCKYAASSLNKIGGIEAAKEIVNIINLEV
jgi:hypothetical protein